jgi:hypothetical protein
LLNAGKFEARKRRSPAMSSYSVANHHLLSEFLFELRQALEARRIAESNLPKPGEQPRIKFPSRLVGIWFYFIYFNPENCVIIEL